MKISDSGVLNFGKHKGELLSSPEVPLDYLLWIQDNVDFDAIEEDILEEAIERRRNPAGQQRFTGTGFDQGKFGQGSAQSRPANAPPPPKQPSHVSQDAALKVVAAGRKTLAKTHHPDTGGDPAQMVAINTAADYLESVARKITPG